MRHVVYGLVGSVLASFLVLVVVSIISFLGAYSLLLLSAVALFLLLTLISWYVDKEIKNK
ncbi:hypothetical protein CKN86_11885 [Carnobacterium divergens]|uniref:hypothetical protein n=1 Tax=Carnobacterium divergens TaxID=2748 RepID=UPI000D6DFDB3|nr:hypothetical protein [Carnobacterium divergens]MCO6017462.1 hypothetical protein [Carnobacterium divergens]MDT2011204.1 hypothetical protein [Carnobacterium divergens]TFI61105.1 hypothetical protein CKN62_12025 [Carnobacterium divergens]TFI88127.1 hypothetical protein CKN84_11915 [Carnobacterium divergens]TFJ02695.1 hypothetical protein CKN86_11885 [Carnobacterium divergens]